MKKSLFLFVAGVASAALAHGFGEKVVAFYPFRDGAAGTSAVGKTLTNLIDKTVFPGRVEQTGEGDILFSDEHPAQYVFNDLTWNAPIAYENPGSLYFPNSGNKANHAKLFFDGVVKYLNDLVEASGNNNDAWKIEFFFKCDTDQYVGNGTDSEKLEPHIFVLKSICDVLEKSTDTATHTNGDFYARFFDNGGNYRLSPRVYAYRVSDGAYEKAVGNTWSAGAKEKMKDGKWHYLSVSSGYNGFAFCGQPNYASDGNNFRLNRFAKGVDTERPSFRKLTAEDVAPMLFNPNGNFRGWISCLKITRNEGIQADGNSTKNMHCSEVSTCVPRTISHLRFEDGAVGGTLTDAANIENAAALSTVNTNISYFLLGRGYEGTGYYGMPQAYVSTDEGASIAYTNDVKRRFVYEKGAEDAKVANARSIEFTAPTPTDRTTVLKGVGITYPATRLVQKNDMSPMTWELFARFDYVDWTNRIASATDTAKKVSLMYLAWSGNQVTGSYDATLALGFDLTKPAQPKVYVDGYAGSLSYDLPQITDGKWHHYAVSFQAYENEDKADFKLYVDYKQVSADGAWCYFYKHNYNAGRYIFCMKSNLKNLHGFNGEVDELRISNGLLEPADFLRQRSFEGAAFIVK